MNTVAIVAIVAMLLAFLVTNPSADLQRPWVGPAEVILTVLPPQVVYVTPPTLPDRNPRR